MPEVVAGFIGIAVVFVWIYCLYDVVTTEDALVRNLPKIAWFVIVLVLFDIGSILWLCFGRPRIQGGRVVEGEHPRSRRQDHELRGVAYRRPRARPSPSVIRAAKSEPVCTCSRPSSGVVRRAAGPGAG